MKITVLEPSGRLYGSEFCLLDIIDGLSGDDFQWRVFLPNGGGFDRLLLNRDIECEFLIPSDLSRQPRWKKAGVYLKILLGLRRKKPDLLYVNQAGSLRSADLYARYLNLPIVCQVQTLEDARWLSGNLKLHRGVRAFICNSEFVAGELDCADLKKCVLYQGITPERLAQAGENQASSGAEAVANTSPEQAVIGILGRIAISKGHYLLLDAARRIKKALPACRFVVIGEGLTNKDTEQFVDAVRHQGLEADFEFRGYRQNLAEELSRLNLLVIPSLAEPLGRVLFDAIEHGLPVVLSDAGGLGEMSRRFEIGQRFRSGDPKSLAGVVIDSLENYSAVRKQFHLASVGMFERLSMDSYLSSVEKILRAAAAKRSANVVWLGDG